MAEENISQEFRLENINETRNYLIKEINRNELMSKKHKKICATLNYTELILASTITGCITISASLIGILVGITSSVIGLKICAIAAEIKNYQSTIKKKKKKHDKVSSLAKSKIVKNQN